MAKRKYLDDLEGYVHTEIMAENEPTIKNNDERKARWAREREVYGFDVRQTWAMGSSMLELLYERLCMYKEDAPNYIYVEAREFDVFGVTMNRLEIINEMIRLCELVFLDHDEITLEDGKFVTTRIWELWTIVHMSMGT